MNIIDDFIKLDMDAPQIAERTEKDLAFNRKVKQSRKQPALIYRISSMQIHMMPKSTGK